MACFSVFENLCFGLDIENNLLKSENMSLVFSTSLFFESTWKTFRFCET